MPQPIPVAQLNAVFKAVAASASPGSLEEIARRLPHSLPRRTLQRRLAELVAAGRIVPQGVRAGRRYRLPGSVVPQLPLDTPYSVAEQSSPAGYGHEPLQLSAAAQRTQQ